MGATIQYSLTLAERYRDNFVLKCILRGIRYKKGFVAMSIQEKEERGKLSEEDRKLIGHILRILIRENEITSEEQLCILDLLREGK